jgi:hypothetical protein
MPQKRKKKLTKAKLVKAAAREQVGMPPPTRRAPDPKKKRAAREKHKPTLGTLLTQE